ncbi:membrane protein insertase YidC [Chitinilyticum piscinae]|uniref:Membrane protein insertase YidC n=1 Tax=Chitinilyticum piscinae TaxID=2866724 RepID=A0A8J7FNX4_9NEIS|nr:membrane protein insertase YidC [Chitinilyticum piscinae]MBE9607791.1 membrane protein insertase YidC [Chitinilyticum piscinae]
MDTKRLIIFIVLSFGILFGWQTWMEKNNPQPKLASAVATASGVSTASGVAAAPVPAGTLAKGQVITVETDLLRAEINTVGGDIRYLELLKIGATDDPKKPFVLLQDRGQHTYVAQSGLKGDGLPDHTAVFTAAQTSYKLAEGQDAVDVKLEYTGQNGVKTTKVLTFKRGSYLVNVSQQVTNSTDKPLAATGYYRLIRDGKVENPGMFGTHTYTGPAVYTEAGKFQKNDFSAIAKGEEKYVKTSKDGWVAMVQHYFVSAWLLNPIGQQSVCAPNDCRFELGKIANSDNLFYAGTLVDLPQIAPGASQSKAMSLYLGPQETKILDATAVGLDLAKDYGMFAIFSKPLFWLLDKIHAVVGNWGWAIVIVTLLIKAAFYPLSNASYRSMAKMRKLTPRMEALKERFGDDKMKFQQAVMEMYKTEKVNPLGGCLPILIQIPVFIAFYWMLIAAVEMRQAPWAFWITDLSVKDPYYILPVIYAVSMYVQQLLSPPPPDPMQAKMMKMMPVVFSVFFLFFPSGLVLYWVVNNLVSIAQQWWITHRIEQEDKKAAA